MTGSLDSRELLERELEAAGFHDITLRSVSKTIRFPSTDDFVWQFVRATPMVLLPCVNEADASKRADVIHDVAAMLEPCVDRDGVAVPIEAHMATARK
jgi:hypothetical protein